MKFSNFANFWSFWSVTFEVDLQTTKFLHFWNQRAICNKKKYHISIWGNFNFWPSYENFQSSRPRSSRQTLKQKKIKFAEIYFTSYHSFLRLRKVKKINLKLPHTKKTMRIGSTRQFFFEKKTLSVDIICSAAF
jgi:hypothetical protein